MFRFPLLRDLEANGNGVLKRVDSYRCEINISKHAKSEFIARLKALEYHDRLLVDCDICTNWT
jgi:hypothetical protein